MKLADLPTRTSTSVSKAPQRRTNSSFCRSSARQTAALQNYTAAEIARQEDLVRTFEDHEVTRKYALTTDTWNAGDLSFRIISPVLPIPDPDTASDKDLTDALLPAVFVEIDVDNSEGKKSRRVAFGFGSTDSQKDFALHYLRHHHGELDVLNGIGQGRALAIVPLNGDVSSRVGFDLEALLVPRKEPTTSLGGCAMLVSSVAPGQKVSLRFAVCFHREGVVTTGLEASYLYTRWWKSVRDVAKHAVKHHERLVKLWATPGSPLLAAPALSDDQLFHLIHTVHSYYGSTQLLQLTNGRPFWIVNEGEYRMINTLDLVIDHAFYELALNPWTVRNNLDAYATTHSYYDEVKDPRDTTKLLTVWHLVLPRYGCRKSYQPAARLGLRASGPHGLLQLHDVRAAHELDARRRDVHRQDARCRLH